jgi:hypothetical protein
MTHNSKVAATVGAVVFVIAVVSFFYISRTKDPIVTNYEECVAAGYPIQESFPPQCVTPDGRTFTGPGDVNQDGTTSADGAPEGSLHNLPVPAAVTAARRALAERLGIMEHAVVATLVSAAQWSDSCLGLGGPAESCAAVITPGYEITLQVKTTQYVYRTDADGTVVREVPRQ